MVNLRKQVVAVALLASTVLAPVPVMAETLFGAMQKTYNNNATLNYSRAGLRATDENVAIAKSGYRPTLSGTYQYGRSRNGTTGLTSTTGTVGIELNQTLFDGFQTKNSVASAESTVYAQRENLRNTEQNSLYDAVTAYMNVYQNRQIANLRKRNLAAMDEQVRSAKARLEVGEGTRTDVAQADAQRSAAVAQLNSALADVKSAEAVYLQVTGTAADKLQPAKPASKSLPKSVSQAFTIAEAGHPGIKATQLALDAAGYNVKVNEGALLPTVGVTASASHSDVYAGLPMASDGNSASIGVGVKIPLYSGGKTSANVRKSKELLGQARIEIDVVRDQVRTAVADSWSQLDAAKASIAAYRSGITAARLALEGVIEERNVGQRTTLDVLNAQNELIDIEIEMVQAERNVVVASYAVLASVGRLSARDLGLKVAEYKPEQHYDAVKNKWIGLRTPDGR